MITGDIFSIGKNLKNFRVLFLFFFFLLLPRGKETVTGGCGAAGTRQRLDSAYLKMRSPLHSLLTSTATPAPTFKCSFKLKPSSLSTPPATSNSWSLMLYSLSCKLVPQTSGQQLPPGINYPSRSRRSSCSLSVLCITEAKFAPLDPGSHFKPPSTSSKRRQNTQSLGWWLGEKHSDVKCKTNAFPKGKKWA